MKETLIAVLLLGIIWKGVSMYAAMPTSNEVESTRRFVQLARNDAGTFFGEIESAVGTCAKMIDVPANGSPKVMGMASKILAKSIYDGVKKGDAYKKEDAKPELIRWLHDVFGYDLDKLPKEEADKLASTIDIISKSPNSIGCITSTALSLHDKNRI